MDDIFNVIEKQNISILGNLTPMLNEMTVEWEGIEECQDILGALTKLICFFWIVTNCWWWVLIYKDWLHLDPRDVMRCRAESDPTSSSWCQPNHNFLPLALIQLFEINFVPHDLSGKQISDYEPLLGLKSSRLYTECWTQNKLK